MASCRTRTCLLAHDHLWAAANTAEHDLGRHGNKFFLVYRLRSERLETLRVTVGAALEAAAVVPAAHAVRAAPAVRLERHEHDLAAASERVHVRAAAHAAKLDDLELGLSGAQDAATMRSRENREGKVAAALGERRAVEVLHGNVVHRIARALERALARALARHKGSVRLDRAFAKVEVRALLVVLGAAKKQQVDRVADPEISEFSIVDDFHVLAGFEGLSSMSGSATVEGMKVRLVVSIYFQLNPR